MQMAVQCREGHSNNPNISYGLVSRISITGVSLRASGHVIRQVRHRMSGRAEVT